MAHYFTDLVHDMESSEINMAGTHSRCNGVDILTTRVGKDCTTHRTGCYFAIDNIRDYDKRQVITALSDILARYMSDTKRVLVVGFGNEEYTCDSLGRETLQRVNVNESTHRVVMTIAPLVESITGMDSIEIVRSLKGTFHPDIIIAVDTLATSRLDRLGNCIQLTDAGMSPGAGVGARGHIIDSNTMGVTVMAVGVPLVVNARAIAGQDAGGLYLIPSTIDNIVDSYSDILASSIMSALLH